MQYTELFLRHQMLTKKLLDTQNKLSKLPDGYISKKKISGKTYPYLQKRVRGKMQSRYIKAEQLPKVRNGLSTRSVLEGELTSLSQEINTLEQAAAVLDATLLRSMLQNKRSLRMDMLSVSARQKSLSFSMAMLSLEGETPSADAKGNLQAWCEGKKSFLEGYQNVLQKYNLTDGEPL